MIKEINDAWSWKGFNATEVIRTNDFGNVIFKTDSGNFWRLCPEELSCELIANNIESLNQLIIQEDFKEDWEMSNLVNAAKQELGELLPDQKYCLKIPAVIGGEYEISNFGKIPFTELIAFSGDIGFQIKDLKQVDKIKIQIEN